MPQGFRIEQQHLQGRGPRNATTVGYAFRPLTPTITLSSNLPVALTLGNFSLPIPSIDDTC